VLTVPVASVPVAGSVERRDSILLSASLRSSERGSSAAAEIGEDRPPVEAIVSRVERKTRTPG
jgi:hypothetical protein